MEMKMEVAVESEPGACTSARDLPRLTAQESVLHSMEHLIIIEWPYHTNNNNNNHNLLVLVIVLTARRQWFCRQSEHTSRLAADCKADQIIP